METAVLSKRIWLYIINLILYLGLGFLGGLPFLIILKFPPLAYLGVSLGFALVFSIVFDFLLLLGTGYTVGSAILGVKYVASDGEKMPGKMCFLRSLGESILILALFDLIYFVKNRTERGIIDRLSNSFSIDNRR